MAFVVWCHRMFDSDRLHSSGDCTLTNNQACTLYVSTFRMSWEKSVGKLHKINKQKMRKICSILVWKSVECDADHNLMTSFAIATRVEWIASSSFIHFQLSPQCI